MKLNLKSKKHLIFIFFLLALNDIFMYFVLRTPSSVRLSNKREQNMVGNYEGRGTITLLDKSDLSNSPSPSPSQKLSMLEIGFYEYGTGLFTEERFEFWTGKSVSIANHKRTPNLEVRNYGDTKAGLWLNGAGELGSQHDSILLHLGQWNGDRANMPNSPSPEFQFKFNKEGVLTVKEDIIVDGVSIKSLMERLKSQN